MDEIIFSMFAMSILRQDITCDGDRRNCLCFISIQRWIEPFEELEVSILEEIFLFIVYIY